MTDHTPDIDYELLAKAADDAYDETERDWQDDVPYTPRAAYAARAVAAAYREQLAARGVVEVSLNDLDTYLHSDHPQDRRDAYDRIRRAMAASGGHLGDGGDSAPQTTSSDKLAT
jgi:hypothetical protein